MHDIGINIKSQSSPKNSGIAALLISPAGQGQIIIMHVTYTFVQLLGCSYDIGKKWYRFRHTVTTVTQHNYVIRGTSIY